MHVVASRGVYIQLTVHVFLVGDRQEEVSEEEHTQSVYSCVLHGEEKTALIRVSVSLSSETVAGSDGQA